MAQMKEQIKIPIKELSDKEIDNLSDAEFKTLVIRMLTELVEFGHKIKEERKAIQSEIKENIQGTNSEGKDTGTQINDLEQKEEISIQPEKNEEIRIQKNKERLRNLWDNCKCSNVQIISVPEGEQEKQKTENLFEQIMNENFPHLPHSILLPPLSSFVFVHGFFTHVIKEQQGFFFVIFFYCCSSTVVSIFSLPLLPTSDIPTSHP